MTGKDLARYIEDIRRVADGLQEVADELDGPDAKLDGVDFADVTETMQELENISGRFAEMRRCHVVG